MIERKEPTLGNLGAHPESEPRRPAPAAGKPAPTQRPATNGKPAPSAAIRAAESQSRSGQGLLMFTLLLAIAGLAGSAYLAWQTQQLEVANAATRAGLEARIAELEGKLSVSEGEALESAEQMKAKLVWADSEIRKLWGVSYDTNRKAIAANTDSIDKLTKRLDSNTAKLLADVKAQLGNVDGKLLAAQATVDEQMDRMSEQVAKLQGLEKQLNQLRTDLSGRLKSNEEAIKAIDVYRLSINRDLLALKEKLNAQGQ